MGDIIQFEEYRTTRIASLQAEVERLLVGARILVDEARESKYDFGKVAQARVMVDKAVQINKEIRRLEGKVA